MDATALALDVRLRLDQPPLVGKSGHVNVYNARGSLVDTIHMATNPQTPVIGGNPYCILAGDRRRRESWQRFRINA